MSEYRFIAFPKGVTPTAKEVAAFRGYAELLNDRVAYGKQRNEAGLAICCQAEPFDKLRGLDPKFASLLKRWEKQGAEVVSSLPFTRDKQPWREISPKKGSSKGSAKSKPREAEPKPAPERPKKSAKPARTDRPSAPAAEPAKVAEPSPPSRSKAWLLYVLVAIVAGAGFSAVGYFAGRRSNVDAYFEELERRLAEEENNAAAPEGDRGVEVASDGDLSEAAAASER